jgi:hypothetical protein
MRRVRAQDVFGRCQLGFVLQHVIQQGRRFAVDRVQHSRQSALMLRMRPSGIVAATRFVHHECSPVIHGSGKDVRGGRPARGRGWPEPLVSVDLWLYRLAS